MEREKSPDANSPRRGFSGGPGTLQAAPSIARIARKPRLDDFSAPTGWGSAIRLDVSPFSPTAGETVTLAATVTRLQPDTPPLSGVVELRDGGTLLGTSQPVDETGLASITTTFSQIGNHQITATFAGTGFAGSTHKVNVVVRNVTATALVVAPASESGAGQPVTLTATVTSDQEQPVTSGLVRFTTGTTELGVAAVDDSGIADLDLALETGAQDLQAHYMGTHAFGSSASATVTHLVKASASIDVTPVEPIVFGQNTTVTVGLTAATGDGVPSGTMRLVKDGTEVGPVLPVTDGSVTIPLNSLPAGRHTFIARYGGDAVFSARDSAPFDVVVTRATLPVQLFVQPAEVTYSTPVTLTARVSTVAGVSPSGFVSFRIGEQVVATAALNLSGVAVVKHPGFRDCSGYGVAGSRAGVV